MLLFLIVVLPDVRRNLDIIGAYFQFPAKLLYSPVCEDDSLFTVFFLR